VAGLLYDTYVGAWAGTASRRNQQPPARRRAGLAWGPAALLLAIGAAACGGSPAAATKPHGSERAARGPQVGSTLASFICKVPDTSGHKPMVSGTPDLASVPDIETISLTPVGGGLSLDFKFREPFELAPAGVYISWTVYVYRSRNDASNPQAPVELQVEDRGAGWEPSGWTILASQGLNAENVSGEVRTDKVRDEIRTLFPAGFANIQPPFYWYASQVEYRAYLPKQRGAQDWSVNGSVTTDCPAGVRADPSADQLPDGSKLLRAR
jgi:hypothetical protein